MRWLYLFLAGILLFIGWQTATAASAVYSLAEAVERRDAIAILDHTDVPRLRRSITQQIVDAYLKGSPSGKQPSSRERMIAVTYGSSVIDAYVGKLLTAENVARFLRDGTIEAPVSIEGRVNLPAIDLAGASGGLDRIRVHGPLEFRIRTSAQDGESSHMVMRSNIMSWKLSGIELPPSVLARIVEAMRKAATA